MFGVGAPAYGERHAPSETITHDKETKLRFNDFLLERGVHILDVSPPARSSAGRSLLLSLSLSEGRWPANGGSLHVLCKAPNLRPW